MKNVLAKIVSFKIPRCIVDLHVHGRDMVQRYKTTVEQVLRESIASLINVVAFMPNTQPPINNIGTLDAYVLLINRAKSNLNITSPQFIWFGVTDTNLSECNRALERPEVIGLKIYSELDISNKTITAAMKLARRHNKVVAIHCDEPSIIRNYGHTIDAEVTFVRKCLWRAEKIRGVKIMFCHISCAESATAILGAQKLGIKAAIELCIQYLWFDKGPDNKRTDLPENFYQCLNRLRLKIHRDFLISLLFSDNKLIFVHSDSACHIEAEKLEGANGIPSNQQLVNGLVTLAIKHGISEERVAELLSYNAIDFFNMPFKKGLIKMKWEPQPDNKTYNNGKVINPWLGLMMYQPIKK